MRIPSGVVDQYIYFIGVDATDLKTRETGLSSFTVYRSRNGGAAAVYTTPTVNETDVTNMPGVYELLLDEDMTIDAGDDSQEVCLHITATGMAPVTRTFELYRPKLTAGNTLGVESDGDLTKVNTLDGNTAQTADHTASIAAILTDTGTTLDGKIDTIDTNVDSILADTGTDGVVLANDAITAAKIAANAITSSELADGAITAAKFAAGAIDATAIAANAIGSSEIADGAITAGKIATDAIDADALAADAVTEIWAKAIAEPTAITSATPTVIAALALLHALARNKITQTSTTQILKADDGTTTVATSTLSDDGTTFTRGEFA